MSGRHSLASPPANAAWQDEHYDRASIVLHWASALLILINWLLGQEFWLFARGAPRAAALSTHTLIGLTIALLLLTRLVWRAGPGRRLAGEPGFLGVAAKAMHATLYALIGLVVLAGASRSFGHGYHFYGTLLVSPIAFLTHGPFGLLARLHVKLADLLIVLAALHALAALAHHVVLGDRILLRMAPFLPSGLRRARPGAGASEFAPTGRDGGG
jgi:cytochrome b561